MAQALEEKLLDVLAGGPQSISNLAGKYLGKAYNDVFHAGVKKNNGSFKSWVASVDGVEVVPDPAWGGKYCVKLAGQEIDVVPAGNSSVKANLRPMSGQTLAARPANANRWSAVPTKGANPMDHSGNMRRQISRQTRQVLPSVRQGRVFPLVPIGQAPPSALTRAQKRRERSAGWSRNKVSRSPDPRPKRRRTTNAEDPQLPLARERTDAQLPRGWERHWDGKYGLHYYWNCETEESRWTPP